MYVCAHAHLFCQNSVDKKRRPTKRDMSTTADNKDQRQLVQNVMRIVDDHKMDLYDESYRQICLNLQILYNMSLQPKRAQIQQTPILTQGGYFIVSPDLMRYLGIHSLTEEYGSDFDLCVRYDGQFLSLPRGQRLGQHSPMTQFERDHGWEDPDRQARGPFFKFTPNVNFTWAVFRGQEDTDLLDMPTMWLEGWMLNMLSAVGPGGFYERIVTFPGSYGLAHETFRPMFLDQEDPTLYDRYHDHDTEDEHAQSILLYLPDDHRLRWTGWERGMKFGLYWRDLRDYVQARAIAKWWCGQLAAKVTAPTAPTAPPPSPSSSSTPVT